MITINKVYSVYRTLEVHERKRFFLVLTLLIVSGIVEVFGLALLLGLIYLATNLDAIKEFYDIQFLGIWLKSFEPKNLLSVATALIVLVFLLKSVYFIWFSNFQSRFSFSIARSYMNRQLNVMFSKSVVDLSAQNSNKTVQDAITISMEFATSIIQPGLLIFSELIVGSLICLSIAIFDWRVFAGIVVLIGPWIFFFFRTVRSKTLELGFKKNEARPIAFKYVFGAIHGIEFVKITKSEKFFKSKILNSFDTVFMVMRKLIVLESIPLRVIEMAAVTTIAALIFYSLFYLSNSGELLSLIALFATAAYRLMPSLNRVITNAVRMRSSSYVLDRLGIFQDPPSTSKLPQHPSLNFRRHLQLVNVSYSYPGKSSFSLRNVDIKISKGQTIGLIGPSGGGKSTLLKIILGLISPDSGYLKVDETILNKSNERDWYNKIGYVEQNVFILDGSIAENIAFGQDNFDVKRVKNCLQLAQLDDFVLKLKNGVNSNAGEFGKLFSGGQKQRLGIARALYREAEILVLDEATSALDKETERQILDTLQYLNNKGMTIILISHNLDSLSFCHKIFQVQNGTIMESTADQYA